MKAIRTIWGLIALGLLIAIVLNTVATIQFVDSAMQASQLYDEAIMYILIIIAITFLLNQVGDSIDKTAIQIQLKVDELSSRTNQIIRILENRTESLPQPEVSEILETRDSS